MPHPGNTVASREQKKLQILFAIHLCSKPAYPTLDRKELLPVSTDSQKGGQHPGLVSIGAYTVQRQTTIYTGTHTVTERDLLYNPDLPVKNVSSTLAVARFRMRQGKKKHSAQPNLLLLQ